MIERAMLLREDGDVIPPPEPTFVQVRHSGGEALYIHVPCGITEWWNEGTSGPINDQGCDACESAPDNCWHSVYYEAR